MTTSHSILTGSEIHEPKGIDSAAVNQVYTASGGGSGSWKKVNASMIDSTSIKNTNKVYLNVEFSDISTAQSVWVVCPLAGDITNIQSVIHGAIASANAVITAEIGGTLVTDSEVTVAHAGSAAGDVDSAVPTGANTVTAGQAIELITDGGSSNTVACTMTIEITLS